MCEMWFMEAKSTQAKVLNGVISITPRGYVDALLTLHRILEDKNVEWTVGGDLGEALQTVNTEPDCIEILTTKEYAGKIFEANSEFNPTKISLEIQQLPRIAAIKGKEYPIFARSVYSEFKIGSIKVKVYGDLQYRIADWEWGDKVEFTPDYVYVVGKKTAVVPLSLKYEFYQSLGWTDRAEKIRQTLDRRKAHRR